ncbi:MAG: SH3 domain-containing protein [Lachnospiraceae bacterium]|nr:SH3 domain-containing protein [Lachnospiraceae bacterium]
MDKRRLCLPVLLLGLLLLAGCGGETGVSEENGSVPLTADEIKEYVPESEDASGISGATEETTETERDVKEDKKESDTVGKTETLLSQDDRENVDGQSVYSVEELDVTLYVKQAVNVRKGPSRDYEKTGVLNKGDSVKVTGLTDNGWYRIVCGTGEAFVSGEYLLDENEYAALREAEQASEREDSVVVFTDDFTGMQSEVLELMNAYRRENGLEPLVLSEETDYAAEIRAMEIAEVFSHTRPDGTTCFTVLSEADITYRTAAENIASGYVTPESVMNGWMNSEGHKQNILNPAFTHVGIGIYPMADGTGYYWVQIFTE